MYGQILDSCLLLTQNKIYLFGSHLLEMPVQKANFVHAIGCPRKDKNSIGSLPYGVRFVASGVEMDARIKGMVLSVFITLLFVFYVAKVVFLKSISYTIGLSLVGAFFSVFIGLFITARLPDKVKIQLAEVFSFIPTEGFLHFIVDFLFMKIPFLAPGGKKDPHQK